MDIQKDFQSIDVQRRYVQRIYDSVFAADPDNYDESKNNNLLIFNFSAKEKGFLSGIKTRLNTYISLFGIDFHDECETSDAEFKNIREIISRWYERLSYKSNSVVIGIFDCEDEDAADCIGKFVDCVNNNAYCIKTVVAAIMHKHDKSFLKSLCKIQFGCFFNNMTNTYEPMLFLLDKYERSKEQLSDNILSIVLSFRFISSTQNIVNNYTNAINNIINKELSSAPNEENVINGHYYNGIKINGVTHPFYSRMNELPHPVNCWSSLSCYIDNSKMNFLHEYFRRLISNVKKLSNTSDFEKFCDDKWYRCEGSGNAGGISELILPEINNSQLCLLATSIPYSSPRVNSAEINTLLEHWSHRFGLDGYGKRVVNLTLKAKLHNLYQRKYNDYIEITAVELFEKFKSYYHEESFYEEVIVRLRGYISKISDFSVLNSQINTILNTSGLYKDLIKEYVYKYVEAFISEKKVDFWNQVLTFIENNKELFEAAESYHREKCRDIASIKKLINFENSAKYERAESYTVTELLCIDSNKDIREMIRNEYISNSRTDLRNNGDVISLFPWQKWYKGYNSYVETLELRTPITGLTLKQTIGTRFLFLLDFS